MVKKPIRYLSLFLVCLGMNLYAEEGLQVKGYSVLVIPKPGEHILSGKGRDGKIQFEDGTMFKALPSDAAKVFDEWSYREHITFLPNPYPYGGSEFYVMNIGPNGDPEQYIP